MNLKNSTADIAENTAMDGRVPIILGVTGHRDIADSDDAIRALVRSELQKLKKRYPDTPFVIISALAEGADRIVAQIALDEIDAELIAVLPFGVDEYKKDFGTKTSKVEFERLLDLSVAVVHPPDNLPVNKAGGAAKDRNFYYAWVGAYIAEYCQVLVALWAGDPARGTGGTAEVVDWFRRGFAPEKYSTRCGKISPLDLPEAGWLIHVNPRTRLVEDSATKLPTDKIGKVLDRINRFNQDLETNSARLPKSWHDMQKSCGIIPENKFPLAEKLLPEIRRLVLPYCAADLLSLHYNRRREQIEYGIYAAIALTLITYALIDLSEIWSLAYLPLFLITYFSIKLVRSHSLHNRYFEYRSLAEALRVLFFWRLSGIDEVAWPKYLQKHTGLLSWVRHAVRALELMHDARAQTLVRAGEKDKESDTGRQITRDDWIDAQAGFFENRIKTYQSANRLWGGISNVFFAISFLVTIAFAGFVLFQLADPEFSAIKLSEMEVNLGLNIFQATIGLFAAVAIAVEGFRIRKAYSDLEKQYSVTLQLFKTAQQRLDSKDWDSDAILIRLGSEALIENGEWLWLKSRLPIEIPK